MLFAELKGSMELLAHRDPEETRALLDPVLEHMLVAHCHLGLGTLFRRMGKPELGHEHITAATTTPSWKWSGSAIYRERDMHFWLENARPS